MWWGHDSRILSLAKAIPRPSSIVLLLAVIIVLVLLSGCSIQSDEPLPDDAPAVSNDEIVTDEPAADYAPSEDATPASSDVGDSAYTSDEQRIIYYGDVLAYRYGVQVPEGEWLQVLDDVCASYSSSDSTMIYGPAAADTLEADQREAFLLESFVFLVGGSFLCDTGTDVSNLDRYGEDATLIYLAFTTTAGDYAGNDIDVADFEFSYDLELATTRNEYSDSIPADDTEEYPDEEFSPEFPDEVPDSEYPGPYNEYEGNAGGPTHCQDGTVSNSSGQGTCSHHGGES